MSLNIENLRVSLQKKKILHGIDLEIQEGEFVSLLGKSGCGKTTLLKCIAGLLEQESGDIRIQGASVMDQQPKNRGTVIVFQDLRLFPHMTAEKNIAFPMELRKVPKKEQGAGGGTAAGSAASRIREEKNEGDVRGPDAESGPGQGFGSRTQGAASG